MRKIKVLHITFNMGIGGTEQVIRQLVTSMDEKLVSHEILCIDGKVGAIGEQLQDLGITVTALNRESGFDVGLIKILFEFFKRDAPIGIHIAMIKHLL